MINTTKTDTKERLQFYSSQILSDPENAVNYYDRGSIHTLMGNLEDALSDFDKAIQIKPDFAQFYRSRAILKERMNDVVGALQDITSEISLYRFDSTTFFIRARLRKKVGDYLGVENDLLNAISIEQRDPGPNFSTAVAYFDIADVRLINKNIAGTIEALTKGLEYDPNKIVARFRRASLNMVLRSYAEAIADYDWLIEIEQGIPLRKAYSCRAAAKLLSDDIKGAGEDLALASTIQVIPEFILDEALKMYLEDSSW